MELIENTMTPCPVHDEAFRRIEEKIEASYDRLNDKLDQLLAATNRTDSRFDAIECRLSQLEEWKWYLVGALAVLAIFAPLALKRLGIM